MTEMLDRVPVQRRSATEVGRSIREVFGLDGPVGQGAVALPTVAAPVVPPAPPAAAAPQPARPPAKVAGKRRADVSRWRLR